jgi:hypothetical protein
VSARAAVWRPPDKVRAPQAHKTPGALSNTLESDNTSSVPALQSQAAKFVAVLAYCHGLVSRSETAAKFARHPEWRPL